MRRYVDVRIAFYKAGLDEKLIEKTTQETDQLQRQLWSQAVALGQNNPNSVMIGLFIQSLNEVFQYEAKRLDALENHVPEEIFILLYFAGILTMGLVGYGFGLGGKRNLLATIFTAVLVASVIFLIVDLDRPRRGMIKIGQQSLLNLQHTFKKFQVSP